MDDPNVPVVCRSCSRTVPMREINFDSNKKAYVCKSCFNAGQRYSPDSIKQEDVSIQKEEEAVEALKKGMETYKCPKCKYNFSRSLEKEVKECPYCGSKELEKASNTGADKLIDESAGYE